jgi:hypothetical protein
MVDAETREEREESRTKSRKAMVDLDQLDAAVGGRFEVAIGQFRDFMRSAGFRQHKRGEWRLPRGATMTTEVATAMTVNAPPPPATGEKRRVFGRRLEVGTLQALMTRTGGGKRGEPHPDLDKVRKDVESLAHDLAGGLHAPPIVESLATVAALSWAEWQILSLCDHAMEGRTIAQAEHASRIADRAHRRFIRSVRALAEVRRVEIRVHAHNVQINNHVGGGG